MGEVELQVLACMIDVFEPCMISSSHVTESDALRQIHLFVSQSIPKNELEVARDLFRSLESFYDAFPQFQKRPLIITGESYAGK